MQASAIAVWFRLATWAARVYQGTILPQTASSDGFTSISGQTPKAGFGPGSVHEAFQAWLRDGAPIYLGVACPVGFSHEGVRRVGQAGHPLFAVLDVARQVEAAPGFWLPMMWGAAGEFFSSGAPTGDGTHPRDLYHAMITGRLGTIRSTPGAGYTVAPTPVLSNLGIPRLSPVFTAGALTGVTIDDDGGVDYDFAPPLTILALNGAGSGATARATLTGKRITGAVITAAGSGYVNGGLVAAAGAHPPKLRCVVNGEGGVTTVMDWPSSGIPKAPTISLIGGDGAGAAAVATHIQPWPPERL